MDFNVTYMTYDTDDEYELPVYSNVNSTEEELDLEEFLQFCLAEEKLRQNPGNATAIIEHCEAGTEFDSSLLIQLFTLLLILISGIIVRVLIKRFNSTLPYTVVLMFLGLLLGQLAIHSCSFLPLLDPFESKELNQSDYDTFDTYDTDTSNTSYEGNDTWTILHLHSNDTLLELNLTLDLELNRTIHSMSNSTTKLSAKILQHIDSFVQIAYLHPEVILMTFLPILIFESAFSISAHTFFRSLHQILLLSIVGMLLSTFLTSLVCLPLLMDYKWTFLESSLFGCIISATDPVAVVAILRELGASESLSVVIEGESLLNDGVAVLLFQILKGLLKQEYSYEEQEIKEKLIRIGLKCLQIGIGGPLFGYVMAKGSILFLSKVYNDTVVEISVTLAAAYLTYFVGEEVLGLSGIMAVVVLALVINSQSVNCISPESYKPLRNFWELMGYMANTLLFFLIGLIIGLRALNQLHWMDAVYLFALYGALTIIRFLMLLLMKPLLNLNNLNKRIDYSSLFVIGWGGLRGAVGLCLALEIYESAPFCEKNRLAPKILFHTAGTVLLTLLVNATTTNKLMELLGMTTVSEGRKADVENALRVLDNLRSRFLASLRYHHHLSSCDLLSVAANTKIANPYSSDPYLKFDQLEKQFREKNLGIMEKGQVLQELAEDARIRVIKALKISFWHQYSQGIIKGPALQILNSLCNQIEDIPWRMIGSQDICKYWETSAFDASGSGSSRRTFSCSLFLHKHCLLHKELRKIYLSYEIGKAFVTGVDHLLSLLPLMQHKSRSHTLDLISTTLEKEKRQVILNLGELHSSYPNVAIAAKTKHAAQTVLNHMKSRLKELGDEGLLEQKEQKVLANELEKLEKELVTKCPPQIAQVPPQTYIHNLDWFKNNEDRERLISMAKEKSVLLTYVPGDVIYLVGSPPRGIFLVLSGLVKVHFGPKDKDEILNDFREFGSLPNAELFLFLAGGREKSDLLGPGSLIGEIGYLKQDLRAASAVCETFVTVYFFSNDLLDEMTRMWGDFKLRLWTSWGFKVATGVLQRSHHFHNWSQELILTYLEGSLCPWIRPLSVIQIPDFVSDVVVIEGYYQDYDSQQIYVAPCLVPSTCSRLFSKRNPLTENRLLIISHEDISSSPENSRLFYNLLKKPNSSIISRNLGELDPLSTLSLQTGPRMTTRQRRVSIAISSAGSN